MEPHFDLPERRGLIFQNESPRELKATMQSVGVIPARYLSSRFPGKPLTLIGGRALVQRVFERARTARRLSRLLVATDDDRIRLAVEAFGGEVMMTSPDHPSGTDRLAEVARRIQADVYLNIQGDEPLLDPRDLDRLVESMEADRSVEMVTLKEPLGSAEEAGNPDIVKVVCDASGRAIYFSRSPIPYVGRDGPRGDADSAVESRPWFRHVGIYAYRAGFLLEFASWATGTLERAERLEQLRALEHGRAIQVLPALGHYIGVDTPEDVAVVERALQVPR